MKREEAIKFLKEQIDLYEWQAEDINAIVNPRRYVEYQNTINSLKMAIKTLESQDTCEMTAEEYRQRMIQAFHNAGTGELVALCVLPTEKEFEHLEWLLKNHYKKEPCEDCISRQALITSLQGHRNFFVNSYSTYKNMVPKDKARIDEIDNCIARIKNAPSVTPQQKWIPCSERLPEESGYYLVTVFVEECYFLEVCLRWFAHPNDYELTIGEWRECEDGESVAAWMPLPEPYKKESEE